MRANPFVHLVYDFAYNGNFIIVSNGKSFLIHKYKSI